LKTFCSTPSRHGGIIEGYVDLREALRDEGPFGDRGKVRSANSEVRKSQSFAPIRHSTFVLQHSRGPATIGGMPTMEDFYIGGASLSRPATTFSHRMREGLGCGCKMNFPEIVDLALPAEGVFYNLVFVGIRKTYPMQAYKVLADGHPCTASGAWGR